MFLVYLLRATSNTVSIVFLAFIFLYYVNASYLFRMEDPDFPAALRRWTDVANRVYEQGNTSSTVNHTTSSGDDFYRTIPVRHQNHVVATLNISHNPNAEIVIGIVGSQRLADWFSNLKFWPQKGEVFGCSGYGHSGFIKSAAFMYQDIKSSIEMNSQNPRDCQQWIVVGHSRGGPIAALIAAKLAQDYEIPRENIGAVLYHSPAFANQRLRDEIVQRVQVMQWSHPHDWVSGILSPLYYHVERVNYYGLMRDFCYFLEPTLTLTFACLTGVTWLYPRGSAYRAPVAMFGFMSLFLLQSYNRHHFSDDHKTIVPYATRKA